MNSLPSAKSSLNSESSKEIFNFLRSKKIRKEKVRQEKFNKKIYKRKKLKLRSPLKIGKEVLVRNSRLKKKVSPRQF